MLLAAFCALAVTSFCYQDEEPPPLLFDQSLEKALTVAKGDNAFVVVALPEDWPGEGHSYLSGAFWSHRALRRAASKGRMVIGSPCKHSENDTGSDREGKPMDRVCSRFGQMLCEHHNEIEKQVVARYFDGQEPPVRPLFLVLRGSDGAVLARRLGDPTANELAEIIKTVAASLDNDPVVPSELLGRVNDKDSLTRLRSMRVIASLEFSAADAARKKLLQEAKDDGQRAELLNAMAECGSRALQDVAISQLESKNGAVRAAALRAIGGPGAAAGAEPLVKYWAKAHDDEEKKAIVRGLGRCGRSSETGKDLLKRSLNDTKPAVRANAAVALAESAYGDAATVKTLKAKVENDGDPKARGAAAYALVTMRGVDPKDLTTFFRARKSKEKDGKVIEILGCGAAWLEGTYNEDLHWALEVFCGDGAR
ncbi:MAG: HEAT repeat domain-containing protein [Planctomycetes bacterium]|nr:HEAT repeat domain-containing protein [Planctomycetota bacterium]